METAEISASAIRRNDNHIGKVTAYFFMLCVIGAAEL